MSHQHAGPATTHAATPDHTPTTTTDTTRAPMPTPEFPPPDDFYATVVQREPLPGTPSVESTGTGSRHDSDTGKAAPLTDAATPRHHGRG